MKGLDLDGNTGTCRRGFFVIRTCDKPAVGFCALSNRYICEDCAMEYEGRLVCREEYYKKRKQENKEEEYYYDNTHNDFDYGLWYYFFRDDFYEKEDFAPFDEYDDLAFESSEEGEIPPDWEERDSSGGFYDS